MSDIRHWKEFERLVAAIQQCGNGGAEVAWNEKIGGRQFDCAIRFPFGLYKYLVVVECKNENQPTSAEDLDAFVTKSRDVHANKAIFVSRAGFQSGAKEVAERHQIDLYTIDEIFALPDHAVDLGVKPVIQIHDCRLYSSNKKLLRRLPERPNVLQFFMGHVKFFRDDEWQSLSKLVDSNWKEIDRIATETPQEFTIQIPTKEPIKIPQIDNPVVDEQLRARYFVFTFRVTQGREIGGGVDPNHVLALLNYRSIATGEARLFTRRELTKGIKTFFQVGKFYASLVLDANYLCASIDGELVTLHMIESYQHGKFIQVTFTFKEKYSSQYIEIEDKREIIRLKKIHKQFMKKK